jgi:hypothetical protein
MAIVHRLTTRPGMTQSLQSAPYVQNARHTTRKCTGCPKQILRRHVRHAVPNIQSVLQSVIFLTVEFVALIASNVFQKGKYCENQVINKSPFSLWNL